MNNLGLYPDDDEGAGLRALWDAMEAAETDAWAEAQQVAGEPQAPRALGPPGSRMGDVQPGRRGDPLDDWVGQNVVAPLAYGGIHGSENLLRFVQDLVPFLPYLGEAADYLEGARKGMQAPEGWQSLVAMGGELAGGALLAGRLIPPGASIPRTFAARAGFAGLTSLDPREPAFVTNTWNSAVAHVLGDGALVQRLTEELNTPTGRRLAHGAEQGLGALGADTALRRAPAVAKWAYGLGKRFVAALRDETARAVGGGPHRVAGISKDGIHLETPWSVSSPPQAPNPDVLRLGEVYRGDAGLDTLGPIDPDTALRLAQAPLAGLRRRRAYTALGDETYALYRRAEQAGYTFAPGPAYASGEALSTDLRGKTLKVFVGAVPETPELRQLMPNGQPLWFGLRAVADLYGHGGRGFNFDDAGRLQGAADFIQNLTPRAASAAVEEFLAPGGNQWLHVGHRMSGPPAERP